MIADVAAARLRGRSAIVTGGAGGLGAATARRLVALGARVVVLDRSARRTAEVADELGAAAVAVVGEVEDDAVVGQAIDAATDGGTAVALLVNASGGGLGGEPTVDEHGAPHDLASFRSTLAANAFGTFNACRLVAAAMAANPPHGDGQRGVVVNTGSVAGYEGQVGQLAYAAAKAAVLGMTLPLARDLAPLGIRVCAIAPGPMGTGPVLRLPAPVRAGLERDIVFPSRLGRPDEFAEAVVAVVANPYLNGENVRLDGALRLPPA